MRNHSLLQLIWLIYAMIMASCSANGLIRLSPAGKEQVENTPLEVVHNKTLPPPRQDTLSEDAVSVLKTKYAQRTEYVISSLVNAQKRAYEERYKEAEELLLQSLRQQPTADALLLLGSIYEVQGQLTRADSCWQAAKTLDLANKKRTSQIPNSNAQKTN